MSDRTKVLSVHRLRRTARVRERAMTAMLDVYPATAKSVNDLPSWTAGVRVEKAGPFQWAVVATEHAGH